jgi:predicted DsbA family dithiol-disulfide isomerase
VRLAHRFALESDLVKADCVEAVEFPDLAGKYRVHAVPKTVINETASVEGALAEEFFLDEILRRLQTQPETAR